MKRALDLEKPLRLRIGCTCWLSHAGMWYITIPRNGIGLANIFPGYYLLHLSPLPAVAK